MLYSRIIHRMKECKTFPDKLKLADPEDPPVDVRNGLV
jgi:hypothetical protein